MIRMKCQVRKGMRMYGGWTPARVENEDENKDADGE